MLQIVKRLEERFSDSGGMIMKVALTLLLLGLFVGSALLLGR